ncbi:MAG: periplasmic heavy metal sensor [Pseudomonadota bacterium]
MQAETKTTRCPLWVKILLAASLAVNLCIVGLIAGFALRGGPMGGRAPTVGYAIPYVLSLPRDLRRDVFGAVRDDKSLPDKRARRENYRDMIKVLQAPSFDQEAARAVLAHQGEAASRVQAAAQTAWLEAVAGLSADERAAYADRLQETLKRNGPPKRGKD